MPPDEPAQSDVEWEELAQGREITATVVMASGFVLPLGQRVRERYRLVGSLGKGGMGQVLSVALVGNPDPQTFALKLVARGAGLRKDGTVDEADRAAAEQQAEMFAELLRQEAAKQDVVQRHGVSVARFFALVQLDDGSIGMRMEMARGRSIEQRIADEVARRDATPDTQFSVLIIRKLMTQLRRLHELTAPDSPFGFIHSDIKPGNVFVDDRDRTDPLVTLLDFGVATAGQALAQGIASRGGGRKTLVLEQAGGTIGYAPPHHFTHKPTPLSDVFAAIVMLYELLTGELPWDFAGVRRTVPNLFRIEAILASPPRPVLSVRPSIAAHDAEVLDAFFAREFGAMVALATDASATLEMTDPEPRRAMIARLSVLARDYQTRLEQLAQDLAGVPARALTPPREHTPAPSRATSSTMVATPRGVARTHLDDDDEPVALPVRRSPLVWLLLLAFCGGGAYAYMRFGDALRALLVSQLPHASTTALPVDAARALDAAVEPVAVDAAVVLPARPDGVVAAADVRDATIAGDAVDVALVAPAKDAAIAMDVALDAPTASDAAAPPGPVDAAVPAPVIARPATPVRPSVGAHTVPTHPANANRARPAHPAPHTAHRPVRHPPRSAHRPAHPTHRPGRTTHRH